MLYIIRNIKYIILEIKKNIPGTLISSFGIIFLVMFITISLSVKDQVTDYLKKRVFGELNIKQIKITPKGPSSLFNFSSQGMTIDNRKIRKIKKIPNIENIQNVIRLNCPASLKAGMLGMYLRTDMLISGVDRKIFNEEIKNWKKFREKENTKAIPVVIPYLVMDIYNNFASSSGLPALSPKALNLLSVEMIIGSSSLARNRNSEYKYNARVFGFTNSITTAGIIVPMDFIKKFCKEYSDDLDISGNCYSTIMLMADVKDIKDIPVIAERIKSMDLNVESQEDIAKKISKSIALLNIVFSSIVVVILFLTVIAIFNSYLGIIYNRSDIILIQRMLGASKIRIIFIFVLESAVIGALYGLLGYFSGYYLLIYFTKNIPDFLPLLQGLVFSIEPYKYLFPAVVLSVIVSAASAFIPAVFASNMNIFKAVKK